MSPTKTLPCQPGELTAGESVLLPVLPVLLKVSSSLVPTTLGVGVALVNACKGNEAVAILLTVGTNILVRVCGQDEA